MASSGKCLGSRRVTRAAVAHTGAGTDAAADWRCAGSGAGDCRCCVVYESGAGTDRATDAGSSGRSRNRSVPRARAAAPLRRRNSATGADDQHVDRHGRATLDQQRQLLADTSHELRSPLTVVLANLNLLRRDLEPDERELSITEATDEARRMRRLVNDLLLLAESDRTRAIARAPVRLDLLVEDLVASAVRQTPTHTLPAQVVAPVVIMGDEERLTQLMRNLLDNATRHTQPGYRRDRSAGDGVSPDHRGRYRTWHPG